jgi:hypothetical protein
MVEAGSHRFSVVCRSGVRFPPPPRWDSVRRDTTPRPTAPPGRQGQVVHAMSSTGPVSTAPAPLPSCASVPTTAPRGHGVNRPPQGSPRTEAAASIAAFTPRTGQGCGPSTGRRGEIVPLVIAYGVYSPVAPVERSAEYFLCFLHGEEPMEGCRSPAISNPAHCALTSLPKRSPSAGSCLWFWRLSRRGSRPLPAGHPVPSAGRFRRRVGERRRAA